MAIGRNIETQFHGLYDFIKKLITLKYYELEKCQDFKSQNKIK